MDARELAGFRHYDRAALAASTARRTAEKLQAEADSIWRAIESEYYFDDVIGRKLAEYNRDHG